MGGSLVVQLSRTSSIENEPRTLNLGQIQFARCSALYIINTRDLEEAMRIFTEGLEPVVGCVHDDKEENMMMDRDVEFEDLSNPLRINPATIRDIVTAPF
ncbi:hypothetical protein RND71_009267 [Anisodus tanguticus]|uniref:Uncharacterized protein n=1 Tax=Anisodus tanguticus TaxID=243964 RepID=A0AAE1SHG1_9SOLA|nr:hypothetical protein RND71_009267 [Anisodus tanguticus]